MIKTFEINGVECDIDMTWRHGHDATRFEWVSDDMQAEMDGGPIATSESVEAQMVELWREMIQAGHDGTGKVWMR
jgi:hypothetical protein